MRAAVAVSQNAEDPLSGLELRESEEPEARDGWEVVEVRAASLNPHDLWTLRGVGHPPERIPMILGCDGAGVTADGREVVIYPVMGDAAAGGGDETLDPKRHLLSELINGALAERVVVPGAQLFDKPAHLSFAEAATLGITWGTAFRMLFTRGEVSPGSRVLVQGASGGVGSAAIALARAAGATVYATSRTESKRDFAIELGATAVFEPGARLPERVDVVIETVGEATWSHSLKSLRPGGRIVVAGTTTGAAPAADLQRVFYQQLSVIGSTGCTAAEFAAMLRFIEQTGLRPTVEPIAFDDVAAGFQRLLDGDTRGKLVAQFA